MTVGFYPEPLLDCQKLAYMELDWSNSPDILFHWNWTGTMWKPLDLDHPKVINRNCLNTSKNYVDKVFTQVYGYSSQAEGMLAVEKPIHTNGFKDCHLVNSLQKIPSCFYQMPFIDCTQHESKLVEWRIVIMDYKPVMSILKFKTVTLDNLIGRVDRYEFTGDADSKVERFCRAYPLEYGEIDGTYFGGRFYIYDVNPTPGDAMFYRMPEKMALEFRERYKQELTAWLRL